MAIIQISVSLIGSYHDGRNVSVDDFIRPLDLSETEQIERAEADRGPWASGIIEFMQESIESHADTPEPYMSFDQKIQSVFEYVAGWLVQRSVRVSEMTNTGLEMRLFIDMWIDQDQMDLTLPPSLLLACGEIGIKIQLITND